MINGKRTYFSKTQFTKTDLLFLDYGDKKLLAVTLNIFLDQIFKTVKYSPLQLINYFVKQKVYADKEINKDLVLIK
jgi:hypothetical protein